MIAQTFILPATDRQRIADNLHAFVMQALPGKSLRVEVGEYRKRRSSEQNGATFGLAYKIIMEATGLSGDAEKKQLHRDFCGDFFGWVDTGMGRRKPVRTTTTDERGERDVVNTQTMAQMYDFIQRKAAEFGIYVPDPDPLHGQEGRWAA